jgi:hypothetical protein
MLLHFPTQRHLCKIFWLCNAASFTLAEGGAVMLLLYFEPFLLQIKIRSSPTCLRKKNVVAFSSWLGDVS